MFYLCLDRIEERLTPEFALLLDAAAPLIMASAVTYWVLFLVQSIKFFDKLLLLFAGPT
jgi:hypothetical protein